MASFGGLSNRFSLERRPLSDVEEESETGSVDGGVKLVDESVETKQFTDSHIAPPAHSTGAEKNESLKDSASSGLKSTTSVLPKDPSSAIGAQSHRNSFPNSKTTSFNSTPMRGRPMSVRNPCKHDRAQTVVQVGDGWELRPRDPNNIAPSDDNYYEQQLQLHDMQQSQNNLRSQLNDPNGYYSVGTHQAFPRRVLSYASQPNGGKSYLSSDGVPEWRANALSNEHIANDAKSSLSRPMGLQLNTKIARGHANSAPQTAVTNQSSASKTHDGFFDRAHTTQVTPNASVPTETSGASESKSSIAPTAAELAGLIMSGALSKRESESSSNSGRITPSPTHANRNRGSVLMGTDKANLVNVYGALIAPDVYQQLPVNENVIRWREQGSMSPEDVKEFIPFEETAAKHEPPDQYVIKLTSVPYAITKQELVAYCGGKAPLVHMPKGTGHYAIHIIMDRASAKSMDCFIELDTEKGAVDLVEKIQRQNKRLNGRQVGVELSSQEDLMRELHPKARCVSWNGTTPIIEENHDVNSSGFKGFIIEEELHYTRRFATQPKKARFLNNHQQRPYETMISIMVKYPWNAVSMYTVRERDAIYFAVKEQIRSIIKRIDYREANCDVGQNLLQQLFDVALLCPGFSESQRAELVECSAGYVQRINSYVSPFAINWPFQVLRSRERNIFDCSLTMYLAEVFEMGVAHLHCRTVHSYREFKNRNTRPFKPLIGDIRMPYGSEVKDLTMAEAARAEWSVVQKICGAYLALTRPVTLYGDPVAQNRPQRDFSEPNGNRSLPLQVSRAPAGSDAINAPKRAVENQMSQLGHQAAREDSINR